jgi:hypothetical protein
VWEKIQSHSLTHDLCPTSLSHSSQSTRFAGLNERGQNPHEECLGAQVSVLLCCFVRSPALGVPPSDSASDFLSCLLHRLRLRLPPITPVADAPTHSRACSKYPHMEWCVVVVVVRGGADADADANIDCTLPTCYLAFLLRTTPHTFLTQRCAGPARHPHASCSNDVFVISFMCATHHGSTMIASYRETAAYPDAVT